MPAAYVVIFFKPFALHFIFTGDDEENSFVEQNKSIFFVDYSVTTDEVANMYLTFDVFIGTIFYLFLKLHCH